MNLKGPDSNKEKKEACVDFFNRLCELLKNDYEVISSCNNDASKYLIPNGTIENLTYYGKPINSFRISDHWNWFSSKKKCSDEHYIQCFSVNIPWANKRTQPGFATKPKYGWQVSLFGPDNRYHCVFGESFDRKKKSWSWVESTPEEVLALLN